MFKYLNTMKTEEDFFSKVEMAKRFDKLYQELSKRKVLKGQMSVDIQVIENHKVNLSALKRKE